MTRFLLGLSIGLAGCFLIFLLPTIFFTEQNYRIFTDLAFDVRPGLVSHLEREMNWLRIFMFLGFTFTLIVCAFFGRRLLNQLLKPLNEVEDHMKSMIRGEWHHASPEIPQDDTDRSFFLTYKDLHRVMTQGAEEDLMMLERLVIDPSDREAYKLWTTLMDRARTRLGMGAMTIDSSASSVEVQTSRRAS